MRRTYSAIFRNNQLSNYLTMCLAGYSFASSKNNNQSEQIEKQLQQTYKTTPYTPTTDLIWGYDFNDGTASIPWQHASLIYSAPAPAFQSSSIHISGEAPRIIH